MNDNDLMPFGKYKNRKMANVPAQYLIWLYEYGSGSSELRSYIQANMDVLKAEKAKTERKNE